MRGPLVGSVNDGILTPPDFLLMNMDNMLHPLPPIPLDEHREILGDGHAVALCLLDDRAFQVAGNLHGQTRCRARWINGWSAGVALHSSPCIVTLHTFAICYCKHR